MELCREVGNSFEAVRNDSHATQLKDRTPREAHEAHEAHADTNFSAKIRCLEDKNKELGLELSRAKKMALEDCETKQRLEYRQEASEADLRTAQAEIEQLRAERGKLHAQLKRYSRRLHRSEKEIRVAFCAIRRCGLDLGQPVSDSRTRVMGSD